ncbi:MAG: ribosomal protein S18-alanine N-acetyltransferase [Oscillospiraceae bacterium]|jgi:ribosomal-protein-alanine N-acetyltransferase|nr:ribosomal protein S18-alanine N-acetyltransferase [Oscillospiraceae bacterium]
MLIRNAIPADIDAIRAIELASFSDAWSAELLLYDIENPITIFAVAELQPGDFSLPEARVIAYADMSIAADEAEIRSLAVCPDFRKLGVAAELLTQLIACAETNGASAIYLEVRTSNEAAIALYEKNGFEPIATRKAYYAKPKEDAIVYRLSIEPKPPAQAPVSDI